jgi:hypothetical protein
MESIEHFVNIVRYKIVLKLFIVGVKMRASDRNVECDGNLNCHDTQHKGTSLRVTSHENYVKVIS